MSKSTPQYETIAIVGVGLIGGSIALAARQRGLCRDVLGVGRNLDRLQLARTQGLVDRVATDIAELATADLTVICTPVNRVAQDVLEAMQQMPTGSLITDAGSVKAPICEAVQQEPKSSGMFVGSHPLAGSHRSGFEYADGSLFVGRKCVVTPVPSSPTALVRQVREFWEQLGMVVHLMSPTEHDRVLALTSHLPHLAAAAVAGLVDESCVELAASGFRDTTRVAAGDPELWTAIFESNSVQLRAALDELIGSLQQYRTALDSGSSADIRNLLTIAQQRRLEFEKRFVRPGD